MFTYTKRELTMLALCITLIILLLYSIVIFPIVNSLFNSKVNNIYSNYVYSQTIPINKLNLLNESTNYLPTRCTHSGLQEKTSEITCENLENVVQTSQINNTQQTQKSITSQSQNSILEENKNIKWRIQIPKINLNVHIMEGTESDILLKAVGHFEETSKWQGNVGLAAHNRGYQCNFFAKIKQLEIGDEIIYTTTNGKKVYKVQTNKIIQETDWSYLENTNENKITLITCEENRENYRRCVQAVEIASYKI